MLISTNSIASSRTSLNPQDSLRCFNENDAKTLLAFAKKGLILDSLTKTYDSAIINLEEIIIEKNDQLQIAEALVNSQRSEIKTLKRHNFIWIGVACLELAGILYLLLTLL